MLFNSLQYLLLFLPIVWVGYLLLGRYGGVTVQSVWLVLASLYFYASWDSNFLLLILASVGVNYTAGRMLARSSAASSGALLAAGVAFNLMLLGYFKYMGFFVDNLGAVLGWLLPLPEITLPLAISFFTFQQIAYLVDVHRGEAVDQGFLRYALYVTLFPQLVAGPIVHHREMMPQFAGLQRAGAWRTDVQVGITIICLGLFKKVVLADNLALIANPVFASVDNGMGLSWAQAWAGVLAFAGQIYFDFSGYSDIAIGSARLFGIRLPENFHSPYKASSIIEFWRRWHITLSRFLRDYLYFSLGGNRKGSARRYLNLMLTMLLGGLWHGAHWNFVIWGGLHGVFLAINHGWRHLLQRWGLQGLQVHFAYRLGAACLTLLCVTLAWVFFRAESTQGALQLLGALAGAGSAPAASPGFTAMAQSSSLYQLAQALLPTLDAQIFVLGLLAVAGIVCLVFPNTQQFMSDYEPVISARRWSPASFGLRWRPTHVYACLIALLAFVAFMGMGGTSEFIYFQF